MSTVVVVFPSPIISTLVFWMTAFGAGLASFGWGTASLLALGHWTSRSTGFAVLGTGGLALFMSGLSLLKQNETWFEVKRYARLDHGILRF